MSAGHTGSATALQPVCFRDPLACHTTTTYLYLRESTKNVTSKFCLRPAAGQFIKGGVKVFLFGPGSALSRILR